MLLCSCFPYFPFKCREIQRTTWLEICVVCSVVRGCNLRFRFSRGLLWRDFASTRNPVILSKMLDVPCISEPMAFDSRCVMCLRATKFTPCFYAVSNVLMQCWIRAYFSNGRAFILYLPTRCGTDQTQKECLIRQMSFLICSFLNIKTQQQQRFDKLT